MEALAPPSEIIFEKVGTSTKQEEDAHIDTLRFIGLDILEE